MKPHVWFRPLYRRVIVTLFCAGWIAFEMFQSGGDFWMIIAVGATVYAVWSFFLSGHYRADAEWPEEAEKK